MNMQLAWSLNKKLKNNIRSVTSSPFTPDAMTPLVPDIEKVVLPSV